MKAHRVAADSKRQCRQLFEYPAKHIIIRGVFQRTARKAAQSRGRVSAGATHATSCRQLQLQHMLLASASSNMLSSCCMRRFLSLISIAIAIVARVSAIRSQLLPSPILRTLLLPTMATLRSCCIAACIDCAATNHCQTCFLLRGLWYLQQGVASLAPSGSRANSLSEFHTCELVLCDLQLIK